MAVRWGLPLQLVFWWLPRLPAAVRWLRRLPVVVLELFLQPRQCLAQAEGQHRR